MSTWKGSEIKVSVICLCYNHEKYLVQCLEGILRQQTDFPFELIIHDDASTDGSTEIIRRYQRAYPDIVKPILQTENQYSKMHGSEDLLMAAWFPQCSGDYLAFCEGDDYWVADNKLALQVRALTLNPTVHLCFHAHIDRFEDSGKEVVSCLYANQMILVSPEQVIFGGGGFMSTASLLVRKGVFNDDYYALRKQFAHVGDYALQVHASMPLGALFLPFVGSVYRRNIAGSWTQRTLASPALYINHHLEVTKAHVYLAERFPQYKTTIYKKIQEVTASLSKFVDSICG